MLYSFSLEGIKIILSIMYISIVTYLGFVLYVMPYRASWKFVFCEYNFEPDMKFHLLYKTKSEKGTLGFGLDVRT